MRKPLLFGLPALAAATSCVPATRAPAPTTQAVPVAKPVSDTSALLRQLDLSVPADLHGVTIGPATAAAVGGAPAFDLAASQSSDDAERAADCLTAAVYYEARSEPLDGQEAVAQVVLNRVRDRAFPASVCGVVYQGSERRTGCQFSFTCDGSLDRPRDWLAWAHSRAVAEAALGGFVYAPIGAATFYHANYVSPWWAPSLSRIAAIGNHIFYSWRSAMEGALTFRQAYSGREPDAAVTIGGGGGTDVAVHVGSDPDNLVTIHRGLTAPVAAAAATAGVTDTPAAPRLGMVAGVRIHRGDDPHATDDADFAAQVSE